MIANDTLYSFRRCPYAMRARLAIGVSGIAVELREVTLRDKPSELIAASPKATVPVLVRADGGVIDQSIDIMRWALRRHDPEKWLDGDDTALIESCDDRFKHHLDRYKYPDRHSTDPAAERADGVAWLDQLEARLERNDNLCRPTRALTDLAIMPFVRQFAVVDAAWFDAQPLPGVHGWLARHLASPLFATAMVRLAPWSAGAASILYPG